jgi:hypothetical protein
MSTPPRNEPKNAVTQFCFAMEEHRRTPAGRVRTAREMLDHFFPRPPEGAVDRVFVHMPAEVRGPIIAGWGIRGMKSAMRDTNEKVLRVVDDAIASADIDENAFEEGITARTLVDWIPLADWWAFWRSGKLTGDATQKALATARELGLFDDAWFLANVEGRNGKTKGTDTLCETLSKDQIIAWVRGVHHSGDGSPAGLVAALGWDVILTKTAHDALVFALDALARRVGLVPSVTPADTAEELDPPSMNSFFGGGAAATDAVAEARAKMVASLSEDGSTG